MRQQSVYTALTLKSMMDDLTDEARSQTQASGPGNSTVAFYGNKFAGKRPHFQKQKKPRNQSSSEQHCGHCNRTDLNNGPC